MEQVKIEKTENIYTISFEIIDKALSLIENNNLKEAKVILKQYKAFMQAMELIEIK